MDKYSFKEMDSIILKRLVNEKEEEYLSKKRAKELFDKNIFSNLYSIPIWSISLEYPNIAHFSNVLEAKFKVDLSVTFG